MDCNSIKINGYKIKKVLGHGGMATVYLAIQESFDRKVAIKIMAEQLSSDDSFKERFLQEAKIVSRLIHPNIVTVYDVSVVDNHHYLSMEYIEGVDLKEKLKTISLFHLIKVIKEVALALDYAGRKGYVHRDIKPENIMINNEDGRAVLMDFGIAKAFDSISEMTQTGTAIGTPYYMSPEQAKGKEVDWRSDIYSLGVVFFQVLTGRLPYQGDSAVSVGIMHLTDPIPLLPDYLKDIFQPIIEKLMAKSPEKRYQNGEDIIQALNNISDENLSLINAEFTKEGHRDSGEHINYNVSTPMSTSVDSAVNHFIDANDVDDDVTKIVRINPQADQQKSNKSKWIMAVVATIVLFIGSDSIFSEKNESFLSRLFTDNKENDKKLNALLESTKLIEQQLIDVKKKEADALAAQKAKDIQLAREEEIARKIQADKMAQKEKEVLLQKQEEALLHNEKLTKLLDKATTQEQQLSKSTTEIDELFQTYQLISLLEEQHPKLTSGYKKIKSAYLEIIEEQILQEELHLATESLKKMLSSFPEIEDTQHIVSTKEKIDTLHKINQLLVQADKHLVNNKLSGLNEDNAHILYNKVLHLSPNHKKAKKGIVNISEKYHENIQQLIQNKQYKNALSNIDKALKIHPGHKNKFIVLQTEINQLLVEESKAQAQEKKIIELLNHANKQMQIGNLVGNEEPNALALYKQILIKAPTNQDATAKLSEIESKLLSEVPEKIASSDFDNAQKAIAFTLQHFPKSEAALAQEFELNLAIKRYEDLRKPIITKTIVKGVEFSDITQKTNNKLKAERTIYIGFEFNNFGDTTNVLQAILYAGSVSDKLSTTAVILSKNQGVKFFKISRPVEGFAEGGYFINFLLKNKKVSSYKFSIEN